MLSWLGMVGVDAEVAWPCQAEQGHTRSSFSKPLNFLVTSVSPLDGGFSAVLSQLGNTPPKWGDWFLGD